MKKARLAALFVPAFLLGAAPTATAATTAAAQPVLPPQLSSPAKWQLNPVIQPVPVAHEGAPVPEPFRVEQILRWYDSDASDPGPFYLPVVAGFSDLAAHHPEVLDASLRTTIEINHAVDDPARALADDHDDLMLTMSDAWGSELSAHFRAAIYEGRLPKTVALLAGSYGRGGGIASSTFAEKYFFNYDRPFVVAGDQIRRFHRGQPGDDDEYSTSPSFPSGHTNQAAWKSALMAAMLPEFGLQMLARGSEVGLHRIQLGVHYPLDVIGGRMTGQAAAADRLSDPQFRSLIDAAAAELRAELEWRCGASLAECAARGTAYATTGEAVAAYTARMDYGLPAVSAPGAPMRVPADAEALLAARFPDLTPAQRTEILRVTANDSGAPLDQPESSWQRINLARAWAYQGPSGDRPAG